MSCIVPIVSVVACVLYLFGAFHCFTFIAEGFDTNPDTGVTRPYELNVGYWGVEDIDISIAKGPYDDQNVCKRWGEPELFDGAWKFGKALGILGTVTTISLALLDFFIWIVPLPQLWLFLMGLWHLLNCGMAGFLLFGLRSRICDGWIFNCKLGTGGILAIISSVLWFICFLLFMCLREQEIKLGGGGYIQRSGNKNDDEDHEEEYDDEERLAIEEEGGDNFEEEQAPRTANQHKALPSSNHVDDESTAVSVPTSIKLISLDKEQNGNEDDEEEEKPKNMKPLRRIKSHEPTSSGGSALVHRKSDTKRTDMPTTPRTNKQKLLSNSAHGSLGGSSRGPLSSRPRRSQNQSQTINALVSPRHGRSPRPGRNSVSSSGGGGKQTLSLPSGMDIDLDEISNGDTDIVSMAQHSKGANSINSTGLKKKNSLPPPPRKSLF